jgi:dolichol-phosphate mannosyltransferase
MPLVSVVLSFRNEAENIPTLIARLAAMFATQPFDYELIFVNDASTDRSLDILINERERNPRVKVLNMSRRFGVAEGVLAGMEAARGDAVVYMDADLQDPPEVIPELIARWRAGSDVVHTVRTRRHGESPFKMFATRIAYRLTSRCAKRTRTCAGSSSGSAIRRCSCRTNATPGMPAAPISRSSAGIPGRRSRSG